MADKIVFKLYNPFSQFDIVKEIWTSMLQKCPHSYYLSWAWTEIWIKSLPPNCNLSLVVGYKNEMPVIAFFLGSKTITRHKLFKYRQLALNQTLIPQIDIIYIEYNAFLIDPEVTISLVSLLEFLPIKSWDEFRMTRSSSLYQPNLIVDNTLSKKFDVIWEKRESYYVNLEHIRNNDNDYLALLSKNKQQQIRRSIKEYEKMGDIRIQIANNVEDALRIFDELTELHQKRWTERGYPGALSDEFMINFHKCLISNRFEHGEIQLIKISAGEYTIGCLYNLIYDGKVLFYVCGFNYLPGNVYRPGLVCHYYAILHSSNRGLSRYDFLEGEDDYKNSLSTDYNEMENILVHKKGIKQNIEKMMVKLYGLL